MVSRMRSCVLVGILWPSLVIWAPACGGGSADATMDDDDDGGDDDDEDDDDADDDDGDDADGDDDDGDDDDGDDDDGDDDDGDDDDGDDDDGDDDDGDDDDDDDDDDPSDGCGTPWMPADAEEEGSSWQPYRLVARREMEIAGKPREYLVSVPTDYDPDKRYALVFGFHGRNGDREQLRRYMNVERPGDTEAIMIYPSGLDEFRDTGWDLGADSDDLLFVDALFEKYTGELCIDRTRVFGTGHSFGGCMSNSVGCYRGDMFRAIAPVAGCGPFSWNDACTGQVAALLIHSPKDTATSYSSGVSGCTTWLRANGCDEMPDCGCNWTDEVEDESDRCEQQAQEPYDTDVSIEPSEQDDQDPVLRAYQGCNEGFPVAFADHWRREKQDADDPNERWHNPPPWAPELIWEFFNRLE